MRRFLLTSALAFTSAVAIAQGAGGSPTPLCLPKDCCNPGQPCPIHMELSIFNQSGIVPSR